MITVITPTTGKDSLMYCIDSLKNQKSKTLIKHIILWDNKREGSFLFPDETGNTLDPFSLECDYNSYSSNCIVIKDNIVQESAAGSSLRAIGLMVANSEWVSFMDDDVMWDSDHVDSIMDIVKNSEWGFCKRRIWTLTDDNEYECIGIDEFESVGEDAKTPYKMVDNNCMIFKRKYGVSAACLYRNTKEYNDDRLMYDFLMKYAGTPAKSKQATINQVCPKRLVEFFKNGCTKEDLYGN